MTHRPFNILLFPVSDPENQGPIMATIKGVNHADAAQVALMCQNREFPADRLDPRCAQAFAGSVAMVIDPGVDRFSVETYCQRHLVTTTGTVPLTQELFKRYVETLATGDNRVQLAIDICQTQT